MGFTSSRGKRPSRLHSSMIGMRFSSMNLRVLSRTSRSSSLSSMSYSMKSTPRNLMAMSFSPVRLKGIRAGANYHRTSPESESDSRFNRTVILSEPEPSLRGTGESNDPYNFCGTGAVQRRFNLVLQLLKKLASRARNKNPARHVPLAILHPLHDPRRLAALGTIRALRCVHHLLAIR